MESRNDILLACTIGDLSWLKRGLYNGIEATAANEEGMNGLHVAAKYGQLECLQYLLENCSVDVNCGAVSTGSSALHYSTAHTNATKRLQCTKLLLKHGGSLKSWNKLGETPLHVATKHGDIKLVKLFLEKDADIHAKDSEGQTPYDVACVHNQHECARLLRALLWASKKDSYDREKLRSEDIKTRETNAKLALQEKLRKEASDVSYNQWLEKKGVAVYGQSTREIKQENYSRPTLSSSRASKQPITSVHKASPQLTSTIKVKLKQKKRNLISIGKPEKMQPYTNYPPKSLQRHKPVHYLGKSKSEPSRSGRSSRATVRSAVSVPTGVKYYSSKILGNQTRTRQKSAKEKPTEALKTCDKSQKCVTECRDEDKDTQLCEKQPVREQDESVNGFDRITSDSAEGDLEETHEEMLEREKTLETSNVKDEKMDEITHEINLTQQAEEVDELDFSKLVENDVFLSNVNEYSLEGEEEDLFHDVGQTNSLNALSLPNTLTKDKTPAEVVQLLRSLGGPSRYNRSNSFSHSYSLAHRNRSQRRLSLGAIPEGKIVTSYSDEEQSTSQLLDSQFLESIIFGFDGDNRTNRTMKKDQIQRAANRPHVQEGRVDIEESFDSASECDGSEELSDSTCSASTIDEPSSPGEDDDDGERPTEDPKSLLLPKVEISLDDTSLKVTHPQSLKIVNLAWDTCSNTVHSHISESPLSPPDFSNRSGRWTPTRKLTPPNKTSNSRSPSPLNSQTSVQSSQSPSCSTKQSSPSSSCSLFYSQQRSKLMPSSSIQSTTVNEPSAMDVNINYYERESADEEHLFKSPSHSFTSLQSMTTNSALSYRESDSETVGLRSDGTTLRRVQSAPNILLLSDYN